MRRQLSCLLLFHLASIVVKGERTEAEQLLELELSSGFGEKIQAGRKEQQLSEIKLVFEFELENDDLRKDNVKKSLEDTKKELRHTTSKWEMSGRGKMSKDKRENVEAMLTDKSREGNETPAKDPKFQPSIGRKRKNGLNVLYSNETETRGKFTSILQKWRRHNQQPFYKKPLNLDLKQYAIQFEQQNLTLPTDFLKGNIFKQFDYMAIVEERGKGTEAKKQSLVKSRQGVRENIKDGNPSSPSPPKFTNKSHKETKLKGGNSYIRSVSDRIRHVELSDAQGKRNRMRGGHGASRMRLPQIWPTRPQPTHPSRSPTQPRSRPPSRPPVQASPSALPTISSSTKPSAQSLPVSAGEIAAYLLKNCPAARLVHIQRICAAFGVGQRKSRRGETLVEQLEGQIEDAINVTKVLPRKRKRLKLSEIENQQSRRQPSSLMSRMMEFIKAPLRGIFRLTRMRFGRGVSPQV